MGKENLLKKEGLIKEILKGGKFLVRLEENAENFVDLICYPNKEVRKKYMGVVVGDKVIVEFDKSSPDNGRIISLKN